jgi:hypothetical protein
MTGNGDTDLQTSTHKRTDQLRRRAVLHEGKRRDEQYARSKRGRKHQPLVLTAELLEARPLLAHYLATHDGWPPKITRRSNTTMLNLDAMHAAHGPLVLVTLTIAEGMDHLPLYSPRLLYMTRALVKAYFRRLAHPKVPYLCKIARGVYGGIHTHHVLPLAFLAEPFASLVNTAPHGPGRGCELVNGFIHGVVIFDTPKDRARVAAYVSRHPDERLDTPGTPAYLDALEDDLRRKEALKLKVEGAVAAGRLSWSCGVLPLRRAADSCL